MTFKVADLTKKSKWKLTAAVPFYEAKPGWFYDLKNTTQDAPIGTEFTVQDKREAGTFSDKGWDRNTRTPIPATWEKSGVFYRTFVNGVDGIIFFNDLKDCIELIEQPKDSVVVLKDSVSGKYYVDTIFMVDEYVDTPGVNSTSVHGYVVHDRTLTGRKVPHLDLKKSETSVEIEPDSFFRFANTPLSGKVFKNIGFAKQRLLSTVGYFNDTGNEMLHNRWAILSEIPESWELVEYDRITKTETVLDFDCTEYVKHALELKVLTTKYGSSTRSMYQKLEKKGTLDKFKYFLIFTPGNVDNQPLSEIMKSKYDNPLLEEVDRFGVKEIYDGGSYTIKKEEVTKVKDIVDKKMQKVFGDDSICLAIEDRRDALELTFTYLGNLSFKLIDMSTLKEIVNEEETVNEL